jgi:hypothetical protein
MTGDRNLLTQNLAEERKPDAVEQGSGRDPGAVVQNSREQTQTETEDPRKPATLPDKFWDADKGEVRLEQLINSYLSLEKKLAHMVPAPSNETDRFKIMKMMGMPDSPDKYEVDTSHGLFQPDEEVNKRLHAHGMTPDQVQEVYDLAAEKMVPMIIDMAAEFEADREIERLVHEFGGGQRWREVSRQLLQFGKKNLPEDVLEGLASSYDGVMALYRMMREQQPRMADGESGDAGVADEKELQQMMRDPRYWRDKDPAFVEKVSKGFKELYS